MNTKGQGALEYLLIIGGAVVVAGIVISILMSGSSGQQTAVNQQLANSACAAITDHSTNVTCQAGTPMPPCAVGDCVLLAGASICTAEPATGTAPAVRSCYK